MLPGYFILTAGAFLTGPSDLLRIPNDLDFMRAGMSVAGVGKALVYSFSQTYMLQKCEQVYPPHSSDEIYHKASVLSQYSFGVGGLLAPFSMSLVFNAYGF